MRTIEGECNTMVIITSLDLNKLEGESDIQYIKRLCTVKDDLKMSWRKLAIHLNKELGLMHNESWYRRNFRGGAFEDTIQSYTTTSSNEDFEVAQESEDSQAYIDEKLREIMMRKVQVSDLVTQNNAYMRRLSREETIKEIAHDYARVMNKSKILDPNPDPIIPVAEAEGVLLLSDWHYGMVCDNPWNKFDPEVCKERVNKLLTKVINIVNTNRLDQVHVLDLADLIAGRIHTQIRIESRFDVITQSMNVAEILAEFLDNLSYHCHVSFYSCLDNHSRLEPNKKESMDLESLARLIPWYLKERLKDNTCIEIRENKYGADIITCSVAGHNVIGVHGDNDHPTYALERLSLMTHEHYDMLCTAHRHHLQLEEQHQSMVVSNASLMGVDRYSEKLRLTSDPSQTFIIATPENVCECIYRIVLK